MRDLEQLGAEESWRDELTCHVAVAVIGGTALVGAGISAVASTSAANTQAEAATAAGNQANDTQRYMYDQTRADQAPYRVAGETALNAIGSNYANQTGFAKPFDMNSFYSDPGYQFSLQQGTKAINSSAAAKGGLLSGAAVKSGESYATGLASQTYGDAYNRYLATTGQQFNQLASLAGIGQTSVSQTGQAGSNAANNISATTYNSATQAANARASGYVGTANAFNGAIGAAGNAYVNQQTLNTLKPSYPTASIGSFTQDDGYVVNY